MQEELPMPDTTATPLQPHVFQLEFVARIEGRLDPATQIIGPTAEGLRANFPIVGGTLEGPNLKGTILPGGADFFVLRTDGVGQIDVRATARTDDGAVIYITYTGVSDLGEDGYENYLKMKMPERLRLHIAPRAHTAHPKYAWLNRVQLIGIGETAPGSNVVTYDLYAIR
jgi:hypothetical protein